MAIRDSDKLQHETPTDGDGQRGDDRDLRYVVHELEVAHEEVRQQNESLIQSQAQLEASRDLYTELYDFAPLAYFTLDANGLITSANLTACTMLGADRARLVGLPLLGSIAPQDKPRLLEHLRRCRDGENPVYSELRLVGAGGKEIPVQLASRPAVSGSGTFRTAATDLTASKEAAAEILKLNIELEARVRQRTAELQQLTGELQQSHRRKDEFLAMLGHELRNPLGPLHTSVEILRASGSLNPELGEICEIAGRQVSYMARLIDDLLDVSRISRGKVRLRREPLELVELVRNTAHDLESEIATRSLTFDLQLPQGPLMVDGDRVRLVQVVGNLLNNAIKFTNHGGAVALRLAVDEPARWAEITVVDTGIGIDPETLGGIFEAFRQADRTLDRSRGGLGLGLALVKGLVELHGGTVTAQSDGAGRGATFTVQLPLAASPVSPAKPSEPVAAQRPLRILVIDDRRDATFTMRSLLSSIGHEVTTAADGEAGLQLAREFLPDVILCDIGLPKMDGYAVARAVRRDPALSSTHLIAVTGYGRTEDQRRALAVGFDQHLTKPVGLADLRRTLALLVEKS